MPETPTLAVAGRAYSGLRPVLNRLVYKNESRSLGTSVSLNLMAMTHCVGTRKKPAHEEFCYGFENLGLFASTLSLFNFARIV